MYEGWLVNWRDDFSEVLTKLREKFSKVYKKYLTKSDSSFAIWIKNESSVKDMEMFNIISAVGVALDDDFIDSTVLLHDCFDENMSWTLRNFVLISFVNKIVQVYAMLEFIIDTSVEEKLSKIKIEDFEQVVNNFYSKMDNFDFISLRRAANVMANPYTHFCPTFNYSKTSKFYSPEFFVSGSKFVKDSIKINMFDLKSNKKFESKDNFETQVLSTFKTGYNVLKLLITLMEKY